MKPRFRSLKLEDVKELQELVAAQVGSIEPGLKLLDTRVLLGGATIDLITLDAAGTLTLVALGFQADDELMLRALEAYSWCLEYPDAIRRLYPTVRLSAGEPPRVIFIAEQVPDTFLRKIKHLRFERADCFEFRFGLQFSPVEDPRGADEAGPTQEAVPSPASLRVAPPPVTRPGSAQAGRAAPPPRRREAPAPVDEAPAQEHGGSWGRPGAKTSGEVDEEKARTVREYLQREFPTAVIYDFYAHDRGVQMFHLQDSHGAVIHSAAVSEELLGEVSQAELRAFLDEHKLASELRQAGSAGVSVTKAGLKIEKR
jgi:hypothetical protein